MQCRLKHEDWCALLTASLSAAGLAPAAVHSTRCPALLCDQPLQRLCRLCWQVQGQNVPPQLQKRARLQKGKHNWGPLLLFFALGWDASVML